MNFILFQNANLRQQLAEYNSHSILEKWHRKVLCSNSSSSIQRISSCELEYDVHINDICNKPPQIGRGIANPGLQALWTEERTRRTRLNIAQRLTPPTSPGKNQFMTRLTKMKSIRLERPRTNPFAAEVRHQERLRTNIEKRYRYSFDTYIFLWNKNTSSPPPIVDDVSESNSLVSEHDTTINLAQIERVNSTSNDENCFVFFSWKNLLSVLCRSANRWWCSRWTDAQWFTRHWRW